MALLLPVIGFELGFFSFSFVPDFREQFFGAFFRFYRYLFLIFRVDFSVILSSFLGLFLFCFCGFFLP